MPVSRGPNLSPSEQGASLCVNHMSTLSYTQAIQKLSVEELREGGAPGMFHEHKVAI